MGVPDVVDTVAVEIHVATTGNVLDVNSPRIADRVQAGRRERLGEERALVTFQHRARRGVQIARLPRRALQRLIRVVEPIGLSRLYRGHGQDLSGRAGAPGSASTSAATWVQSESGGGQSRICAARVATSG